MISKRLVAVVVARHRSVLWKCGDPQVGNAGQFCALSQFGKTLIDLHQRNDGQFSTEGVSQSGNFLCGICVFGEKPRHIFELSGCGFPFMVSEGNSSTSPGRG